MPGETPLVGSCSFTGTENTVSECTAIPVMWDTVQEVHLFLTLPRTLRWFVGLNSGKGWEGKLCKPTNHPTDSVRKLTQSCLRCFAYGCSFQTINGHPECSASLISSLQPDKQVWPRRWPVQASSWQLAQLCGIAIKHTNLSISGHCDKENKWEALSTWPGFVEFRDYKQPSKSPYSIPPTPTNKNKR